VLYTSRCRKPSIPSHEDSSDNRENLITTFQRKGRHEKKLGRKKETEMDAGGGVGVWFVLWCCWGGGVWWGGVRFGCGVWVGWGGGGCVWGGGGVVGGGGWGGEWGLLGFVVGGGVFVLGVVGWGVVWWMWGGGRGFGGGGLGFCGFG